MITEAARRRHIACDESTALYEIFRKLLRDGFASFMAQHTREKVTIESQIAHFFWEGKKGLF
jgi:hypothetical protein